MKKINLSKDVFIIENFLSSSECLAFIKESEQTGYEEATVTTLEGQKMIKSIRNNTRVIKNDSLLANEFWNKIKSFIENIDEQTHNRSE